MAWPLTRLTTYNPGSKVKSVDLNAIQDALIKLGTKTIIIPGLSFVPTRTANGLVTPAKFSIVGVGAGELQSDVAGITDLDCLASIEGMPTNATLLNVRYYLKDHATGPIKWETHVYKATNYGAAITEPIAFQLSSGAGTDQTITFTGVNIAVNGGGVKAFLRCRMTGGAGGVPIKIYGAEADIYIP